MNVDISVFRAAHGRGPGNRHPKWTADAPTAWSFQVELSKTVVDVAFPGSEPYTRALAHCKSYINRTFVGQRIEAITLRA